LIPRSSSSGRKQHQSPLSRGLEQMQQCSSMQYVSLPAALETASTSAQLNNHELQVEAALGIRPSLLLRGKRAPEPGGRR
jgi:hypothetical protein